MPLRLAFALPGLHRVDRGAEIAFESLAQEIARQPDWEVTLIGSGGAKPDSAYHFTKAACIYRERFLRWPKIPPLRTEFAYEDLSFVPALLGAYRPRDYDLAVTCSYPFTSWALRARAWGRHRPAHVFVTQNGDWPPRRVNSEYRLFACDGLVCTNVEYYERHRNTWRSRLIPNGVDVERFCPGEPGLERLGLPPGLPVVLIVSALVPSKRVLEGIEVVSRLSDVALLVVGDGRLSGEVDELGTRKLGVRYRRVVVTPAEMPGVYRAADVLLHMSQTEPFGNIYLESMACGLPVVAHDNPSTRWILQDHGFPSDTTSAEAVSSALHKALASRDPAHRSARRSFVVERYAWPIIAAAYCDFFREIIGLRQESPFQV